MDAMRKADSKAGIAERRRIAFAMSLLQLDSVPAAIGQACSSHRQG
jgi:hypothetical protein